MHILIVSALFPPDIANPAPYLKELAVRLAPQHHVTVLTYGAIPEAVAGVNIATVAKQLPAPLRLVAFTFQLIRHARANQAVLIHNAPSTELPTLVAGWLYQSKLFLIESDTKIHYSGWRKTIHSLVRNLVAKVITIPLPLSRPEEHPFRLPTDGERTSYETSWNTYLTSLLNEVAS